MTLTFTVHGKPQPRGSKKAFLPPGAKFPVLTDDNPRSRPWMNSVAATAAAARVDAGIGLFDGPVRLTVEFHFARPKSHFGKRGLKSSAPAWHTIRPDTTKLLRGLEDALKGVVWRDDSQVVQQTATKLYGESDYTVVTIVELSDLRVRQMPTLAKEPAP